MGVDLLAPISELQNNLKFESISKTTSRDTKPRSLPAKVRIRLRASFIINFSEFTSVRCREHEKKQRWTDKGWPPIAIAIAN